MLQPKTVALSSLHFPSLENFRAESPGRQNTLGDGQEMNGNFQDSFTNPKQYFLPSTEEEDGKITFRDKKPESKLGTPKRGLPLKRIWPKLSTLSSVLLVILNTVYLAGWIQLLNIFTTILPKSFAWHALTSPFGAVLIRTSKDTSPLEDNDSQTSNTEYEPPETIHTTPPTIVVIGIVLTSFQITLAVIFLAWKNGRRAILFYVKQLTVLGALFSIFGCTISGSLLYRNALTLQATMKNSFQEYHMFLENVLLWTRSQSSLKCCGVNNYTDWSGSIPSSCCKTYQSNCSNLGIRIHQLDGDQHPDDIWTDGCFTKERQNVSYYGGILVLMTAEMFFIGLMHYLLGKQMIKLHGQSKNLITKTNHRVFIRQGNSFVAFGGIAENNQIIRKNDLMIDTRGSLSSTLSIDDHHISLEIQNFSFKHDQVTVHREIDRINIIVHDKRYVSKSSKKSPKTRGKATITSINESNLDNVVVTPSSNGLSVPFLKP